MTRDSSLRSGFGIVDDGSDYTALTTDTDSGVPEVVAEAELGSMTSGLSGGACRDRTGDLRLAKSA